MTLKRKCQKCPVAVKRGGCLFGCNKKEKLARELDLLIQEADSRTDPVVEQLRQCPEAFTVGKAVERMFQGQPSAQAQDADRIMAPPGSVMSPFV